MTALAKMSSVDPETGEMKQPLSDDDVDSLIDAAENRYLDEVQRLAQKYQHKYPARMAIFLSLLTWLRKKESQ